MHDQHLAVAGSPGTNADGGNRHGCGYFRSKRGRNAFQDHGIHASIGNGACASRDGARLRFGAALQLEAPELVHRLRRHAHVTHDRDAHGNQTTDQLGRFLATFQFHRLGAALLHQTTRCTHAVFQTGLIAHEGHVHHQVGRRHAPGRRATVVHHLVERDRQGAGKALHHHAQAVAHQNDVHPSALSQAGKCHIVGSHGDDLVALAFAFPQ